MGSALSSLSPLLPTEGSTPASARRSLYRMDTYYDRVTDQAAVALGLARVQRLFKRIEHDYYRSTGAFPPQHLIVLRREVWEEQRWIARSLTEAFIAANDCFTHAQRGFPYATPWLEAELEETVAVMGEDFHPYGFERNREQIDMFANEAFRLKLTSRRITAEEYFADYLKGE